MTAIQYNVESLSHARPGIEALVPEHWAKDGDSFLECNPDWNIYAALEDRKSLILIVARDDSEQVIGYLFGIIHRHPNSRDHAIATLSTFYIHECPHRAFLYRSLIGAGVTESYRRGAAKVLVKNKYNDSFGLVLKAMGFEPKTVEYAMTRERETAHG